MIKPKLWHIVTDHGYCTTSMYIIEVEIDTISEVYALCTIYASTTYTIQIVSLL